MTPGFASVAVAVLDHNGTPLAGIASTYEGREEVDLPSRGRRRDGRAISRRLGGRGCHHRTRDYPVTCPQPLAAERP